MGDVSELRAGADAGADAGAAGAVRALVTADAGLRAALAGSWLAVALAGPEPLLGGGPVLRAALAGLGLATALDRAPRTVATAGAVLSLAAFPGGPAAAPWLALVCAAALRAALHLGPGGPLLARVRALRRERFRALRETESLRARAGRLAAGPTGSSPQATDPGEADALLARAGDAFERAGRAAAALRALGLAATPAGGPAHLLARKGTFSRKQETRPVESDGT